MAGTTTTTAGRGGRRRVMGRAQKCVFVDAVLLGRVKDLSAGTVAATVEAVLQRWVDERYEAAMREKLAAFTAETGKAVA